jgi:type VI secretion system secreted protein VgrG
MAENPKLYLFITTPLDGSTRKFSLLNVEGVEEISGLFLYTITVTCSDSSLDLETMIGKKVTVSIEDYSAKKRYINGLVTKMVLMGSDYKHTTCQIEIHPWLWQLTLTSDSKVFQNMSVPDIINSVFQDNGCSDFKKKLTGSYKERIYCVQYQETAFDFISRLMEEEGILYYFEHTETVHTMVLADDMDAHQTCPNLSEAKMKTTSLITDDRVNSCAFYRQITSNQYSIDDYNFETPDTELYSATKAGKDKSYKLFEYPAGFGTISEADPINKKRLQAYEYKQKILIGETFCRGFIAGYKFTIKDHDRKDVNREYVIQKLTISANQKGYSNIFEAFPSDVQFRPDIKTPKPKIYGSQTAVVVGKSGEEIWTDKYGRIKVQFYWDRYGKKDENSSCWIRVANMWAGKKWGTLFTPRIGMEVVVNFLEGDPDQPLITGCVYNASNILPYTLPSEQNKSTILSRSTKEGSAGNEMRFDDTKDSEEYYMHAQKDMKVEVENERTTTIIKSNETLTVKKGDRTVKVETGKEVHEVKGTRSVTVTGNEDHNDKADFTHNVTGNYNLNVDGNLTIKVKGSISIQSDMDISQKAGTSFKNEAGTTFDNKAGVTMTNDGGTMLTDKASAMIKIDGGGMTEVKGGIIKLN